ncbi:MAG: hypothetical protein RL660_2146 [Bacteroidota bacterium]|jgi:hypothetical protein
MQSAPTHIANRILIAVIGCAVLAMLAYSALVFYKERCSFLDLAFHLFAIAQTKSIEIQNYRFGAFFTQLVPFIGFKSGASLAAICKAYSLSFVGLQAFTFLILLFVYNAHRLAIAHLIGLVALTAHTFFWVQSELPQSFCFLMLFIAHYTWQQRKDVASIFSYVIGASLLITAVFTHPLVIVVLVYFIVDQLISKQWSAKHFKVYAIAAMIISLAKLTIFKTEYDAQASSTMKQLSSALPRLTELRGFKDLARWLITDYTAFLILIAFVVVLMMLRRKLLPLIWLLLCSVGFFILIALNYPVSASQFYLENQLQVCVLMVSLAAANYIIDSLRLARVLVFVVALAAVCWLRISVVAKQYTQRVNYIEKLCTEGKQVQKLKQIRMPSSLDSQQLQMRWALCYESWLLSTIDSDTTVSLLAEERRYQSKCYVTRNKAFVTTWGAYDYDSLDAKYFKMQDTHEYIFVFDSLYYQNVK